MLLQVIALLLLLLNNAYAESREEPKTYPYIHQEGQIQFQFNDGSLGSSKKNGFIPANNGLANFQARDRLFIRRFRPTWKLYISPQVHLDTEFNIDTREMKIDVLDLLVNYDFSEQTSLAVGRYKVPFGWEGLRSSRGINTVARSDATVFLYPERDVGVSVVHRREGLGDFRLGTFLGQPRSNGDTNGSVEIIGRASFSLSDSLNLGASGHLGSFRPTGTGSDIPVRRAGLELQWEQEPLRFESEVLWSDGYNVASKGDTLAFGYYFTGIFRVAEPLDLVLGYDRFDPDTNSVNTLQADNATNARDRKVIGLNYYISRTSPVHRVMLNYEIRQSLEGLPTDATGFRLRYQVGW
jgi:phosphate-selective porin O/P